MKYREFGGTGIRVSEIGFGAWGIGGTPKDAKAYGTTDDRTSMKALQRAIDRGISFFDTAPLYGYGHSEELIGMAVEHVRDKIILSSKVGYVNFSGEQNFSPEYIIKSLAGSLGRLKTDYLDIYQLHDPPLALLQKDKRIWQILEKLTDDGIIRVPAISVKTVEDAMIAITDFNFKSIQVNFNLVDQRILACGLLNECEKRGVGLIIRTPLCFGFLTGKYHADDDYDRQDHRSHWPTEQIDRWASAYKLFAGELQNGRKQTNAQIALRFCLSYKQVSTVIPGILNVEHVDENAESSDLGPFPDEALKKINRIYRENQFMVQQGK